MPIAFFYWDEEKDKQIDRKNWGLRANMKPSLLESIQPCLQSQCYCSKSRVAEILRYMKYAYIRYRNGFHGFNVVSSGIGLKIIKNMLNKTAASNVNHPTKHRKTTATCQHSLIWSSRCLTWSWQNLLTFRYSDLRISCVAAWFTGSLVKESLARP